MRCCRAAWLGRSAKKSEAAAKGCGRSAWERQWHQHHTGSVGLRNRIRCASSTDLAIPATPPAAWTASIQFFCSGRTLPVGLLTSMLVKTASWAPTMSGVMVMVRQPIRSALPLHNPNCTGRPLASFSVPVLLRNRRQLPLPQASRMCCWICCSLKLCHVF